MPRLGLFGGFISVIGGLVTLFGGPVALLGGAVPLLGDLVSEIGGPVAPFGGLVALLAGLVALLAGPIALSSGLVSALTALAWPVGGVVFLFRSRRLGPRPIGFARTAAVNHDEPLLSVWGSCAPVIDLNSGCIKKQTNRRGPERGRRKGSLRERRASTARLGDAGGQQAEVVRQGAVGEFGDASAQDGDRLGRRRFLEQTPMKIERGVSE